MAEVRRVRHYSNSSAEFPERLLPPELVMRTEPESLYHRRGGLRPTDEDDVLQNERYTIIRKLGFGDSSTVWLAMDRLNKDKPYVAIKILKDEYTRFFKHNEVKRLHRIDIYQRSTKHPGRFHVPKALDFFEEKSVNGKHTCIVMELTELDVFSLPHVLFPERPFPEFALKPITRDLLLALDFCHNVCGIVHCDVKVENIALRTKKPIAPFSGSMLLSNGLAKPTLPYFVRPNKPDDFNWWKSSNFILNDFGYALNLLDLDSSKKLPIDWTVGDDDEKCTPPAPCYRAPEMLLDCDWGAPVDIWSAGCTLFTLLIGRTLYERSTSAYDIPMFQWQTFGDFPLDLVKDNDLAVRYFDTNTGRMRSDVLEGLQRVSLFPIRTPPESFWDFLKSMLDPNPKECARMPLRKYNHTYTGEPPVASNDFWDFLERMLNLDPKKRATAKELLSHPWLADTI